MKVAPGVGLNHEGTRMGTNDGGSGGSLEPRMDTNQGSSNGGLNHESTRMVTNESSSGFPARDLPCRGFGRSVGWNHEWTRMDTNDGGRGRMGSVRRKRRVFQRLFCRLIPQSGFWTRREKNGPSGFLVGPVAERWTVEARHSRDSHAWINLSVRRP